MLSADISAMSEPVQILQTLYQYLQRFFQQASQSSGGQKLPVIAEQLANRLCQLYWQQPVLLWAQWSLPPKQADLLSRLAVQQAVAILTISEQSRWPQSLQQELVAASLFGLCGLARLPIHDPSAKQAWGNPWLITVKTQQELLRQHRWLPLLISCVRCQQRQPCWQQDPYAAVLCLSYQLCQPQFDGQAAVLRPIEQQYRRLWLADPLLNRPLLEQLAHAGVGCYQTGRFCQDDSGSTYLITTTQPEPAGYLLDQQKQVPVGDCTVITGTGWQLCPVQYSPDWRWYRLFITSELPAAMDGAPLQLAQIQQLNPDWPINRQLGFIEQHPQLAHTLRLIASKLNRQQRAISELRYALAMLGTEQLPARLTQSWLLQQVAVTAHPWQHWFANFADVLSYCLQMFAGHLPRFQLNAVQADLLALCLMLTLQKQPILQQLPLQPAPRQTDSLPLHCRRQMWQNPQMLAEVASLVNECSLPLPWHDAFLQLCITGPGQTEAQQQQPCSLLLQLALMFSELVFMGSFSRPANLEPVLHHAQRALGLQRQPVQDWVDQVLQHTSACWPLRPFTPVTICS